MPARKASVVLMIDTEGEFGRIAFSPKYTSLYKFKMLVSYLLNLDYSIKTFDKMLKILKKYRFPVTLFIVGSLYLENKNRNLLKVYLKSGPKTKYLLNKCKLAGAIPSWGDYLKKQRKNKLFDFGVHNFLHESNFSETDEQIRKSIEYSIKAAKIIGISPKTYSAPWFELEEEEKPSRIYGIIRREGIIAARFDGIKEKGSKTINKSKSISILSTRHGLKCINTSHFIGNGKIRRKEYETIKKGIENAIKTNSIYAISTHDTTFLRHGLNHFENIIKLIKGYEKEICITTLSGIAGRK